jgi:hypothetical protein
MRQKLFSRMVASYAGERNEGGNKPPEFIEWTASVRQL